jgi:hypothetical protein
MCLLSIHDLHGFAAVRPTIAASAFFMGLFGLGVVGLFDGLPNVRGVS